MSFIPKNANEYFDRPATYKTISALINKSNISQPDIRGELLKIFKDSIQKARQKANLQLNHDGDGTKCARTLSWLQDEIIILIYLPLKAFQLSQ
jgi:hypothetical protein